MQKINSWITRNSPMISIVIVFAMFVTAVAVMKPTSFFPESFYPPTQSTPKPCVTLGVGIVSKFVTGDCFNVVVNGPMKQNYVMGFFGGGNMLMSESAGVALQPGDIFGFYYSHSDRTMSNFKLVTMRSADPGQQSYVYITSYESWMQQYQNFVTISAAIGPMTNPNAAGMACDPRLAPIFAKKTLAEFCGPQ